NVAGLELIEGNRSPVAHDLNGAIKNLNVVRSNGRRSRVEVQAIQIEPGERSKHHRIGIYGLGAGAGCVVGIVHELDLAGTRRELEQGEVRVEAGAHGATVLAHGLEGRADKEISANSGYGKVGKVLGILRLTADAKDVQES